VGEVHSSPCFECIKPPSILHKVLALSTKPSLNISLCRSLESCRITPLAQADTVHVDEGGSAGITTTITAANGKLAHILSNVEISREGMDLSSPGR
jgi:hypothetical protein